MSLNTGSQDPMLQIVHLREFAKSMDFEVVGEFVDHMTGMTTKRPALQEMIKQAKMGKFKVIVVAALDRLGRSTLSILTLLAELDAIGVSIISRREQLNFTTPQGRAFMTIVLVMANLEREILGSRISEALAAKRIIADQTGSGWRMGRPPVLTAEIIEQVNSLRATGVSIRNIAKRLGISKSSVLRVVGSKTSKNYQENLASNSHVRSDKNE